MTPNGECIERRWTYHLCNRIGKGDMIPNVDILSDAGHTTFIFYFTRML